MYNSLVFVSAGFLSNIEKIDVNIIVNLFCFYFEIFNYITLKRLIKLRKFVSLSIFLHLIAIFYVESSESIKKFSKVNSFYEF